MNPKKTKEKERRRARKLAQEAWDAANNDNLDLAEKIIRRAVATQPENPVLWNDQGMILSLRGKLAEAEEAFRAALALAPTYAEPFAHLATMRATHGYWQDAVHLMEQAVQFAAQPALFAERLQAYRALAESQNEPAVQATPARPLTPSAPGTTACEDTLRQVVAALNWEDIGQRLTRDGCVLIPALVNATICAEMRSMFDADALFAKTVVMDRADFGQGVYRYFKAPIPAVVEGLRRAVYPHVAKIANEWQVLLREGERFPAEWEDFRRHCQQAGQSTPTPILLKYGPGGFNALHRDLRGTVYFPIQMAVVLSPVMEKPGQGGFRGGEFLLCDVPEGKKSKRRVLPAGLGDAVLFCTRDRLVCVGGAHGLQPVKHGVRPITEGTRLVLGVPFHEYR
jgi:hypothetical protein